MSDSQSEGVHCTPFAEDCDTELNMTRKASDGRSLSANQNEWGAKCDVIVRSVCWLSRRSRKKKKKRLSVVQGNKLCLMSPAQVMTGRREQVFVSDCWHDQDRLIKRCTFDTCQLCEDFCTVSSAFAMQTLLFPHRKEKKTWFLHAAYQMWQTSMENEEKIWGRQDRMAGLVPLIFLYSWWIL